MSKLATIEVVISIGDTIMNPDRTAKNIAEAIRDVLCKKYTSSVNVASIGYRMNEKVETQE